jgi:NAD(P)-dependent dehydrogenase (short-subunit alcohol dehydrogenase family)
MAKSYASVFRPGLFSGQVVIVTGGGSGIGRCTAHELASLGAKVALIGRNPEKAGWVRAEIAAVGGEGERWVCDIREEEKVKETIAAVLARFARIDGLVNNAGGQFAAPLAQMTQKGWDTVVRNNLTGGFLMAREAYTQWMAGPWRRHRQYCRRRVDGGTHDGPFGRGQGWDGQLYQDGGLRVVGLQRAASMPWRPAGSPPPGSTAILRRCGRKFVILRTMFQRALGYGKRGRRRHRLSVERGRRLHLRNNATGRRRRPECPAQLSDAAAQGTDARLRWVSLAIDA